MSQMDLSGVAPEDITWEGEINIGGVQAKIYWAPVNDFVSVPEPTLSPTDLDGIGIVPATPAPVFKDGKGFIELYCTQDAGMIESAGVGEKDGRSMKNSGEIFVPGSKDQLMGFFTLANNRPCILLITEAGGVLRQIGSKGLPAYIVDGKWGTGKSTEERKGLTLKWEAASPYAPPRVLYTVELLPEASGSGSAS